MRCPYCGKDSDRVVDTRSRNEGRIVRRRRLCQHCERRFITVGEIEDKELYVVKSDGRTEPYDRKKLLKGIQIACIKRPVTNEKIEAIVDRIEMEIESDFLKEIETRQIGERVMALLRRLDEIAYVRFASVYRRFADIGDLKQEVDSLAARGELTPVNQLPLLCPPTTDSAIGHKRR